MRFEEIQFIPIRPRNGLIGFCSMVVDQSLCLSGIAVYTRPSGGYRLVFPTKEAGERRPLFFPIDAMIGIAMEEKVSETVEKVMKTYDRHHSANL